MTPSVIAAVAAGGAIGAVARYVVMAGVTHYLGPGFPWGTLVVNILGSFAMGVLIELSALVWSPGPEIRALIAIGLLGAFTTFSTFSLDVVSLLQRGALVPAGLYVAGSVLLCVAGLYAGLAVVRALSA